MTFRDNGHHTTGLFLASWLECLQRAFPQPTRFVRTESSASHRFKLANFNFAAKADSLTFTKGDRGGQPRQGLTLRGSSGAKLWKAGGEERSP